MNFSLSSGEYKSMNSGLLRISIGKRQAAHIKVLTEPFIPLFEAFKNESISRNA